MTVTAAGADRNPRIKGFAHHLFCEPRNDLFLYPDQ